MFDDYFSRNLKEGEKVFKILHQHWGKLLFPILKTFLILIIPFLISSWLFSNFLGVIIFFVWVLIGLAYGLHQILTWYFNSFVITNQRLININQKSLFRRSVSEVSLGSIEDITYEIDGFLASLFNYGILKIKASSASLEISAVEQPKEVQELILKLKKEIKRNLSAKELVDFLEKAKDSVMVKREGFTKKEI